jgi:DnaJ-class molecular chaperone
MRAPLAQLGKYADCPKCKGSGRKETHKDGSYTRCSYCHGEGVEPADLWRW